MNRIETHIESAKSIEPWFSMLWNKVKDFDYKLIGKPYGCSPILDALNIDNYQKPGIEHELIKEIDYADFTLGNSLGISLGIKLSQPHKSIFVFLSDAQLYMGSVLEAFILLKEYNFIKTVIAIDYNFKGSKEIGNFQYNNLNLFKLKKQFKYLKDFNQYKLDDNLNIILFKPHEIVEILH